MLKRLKKWWVLQQTIAHIRTTTPATLKNMWTAVESGDTTGIRALWHLADGKHHYHDFLHHAAQKGDVAMLRAILALGFQKYTSHTDVLSTAAGLGHTKIVQALLRTNIVHGKDHERFTATNPLKALTAAAASGHTEVVQVLWKAIAPKTYALRGASEAARVASQNGHAETALYLLKCLSRHKDLYPHKLSDTLRAALMANQAATLATLCAQSDVSVLCAREHSLLHHHMTHHSCRHGHTDIVCTLLDAGVPINPTNTYECQYPLTEAVEGNHETLVRLLLNKGANAKLSRSRALQLACVNNNSVLFEMLYEVSDPEEALQAMRDRGAADTQQCTMLAQRIEAEKQHATLSSACVQSSAMHGTSEKVARPMRRM